MTDCRVWWCQWWLLATALKWNAHLLRVLPKQIVHHSIISLPLSLPLPLFFLSFSHCHWPSKETRLTWRDKIRWWLSCRDRCSRLALWCVTPWWHKWWPLRQLPNSTRSVSKFLLNIFILGYFNREAFKFKAASL